MHPLIPLAVIFFVLAILGVIGVVVYGIVTDIADKTSKRMAEKNVSLTQDGMRIGVRQIKDEDYVGKTQNVLVKAWNLSSWPQYKSRLWNQEAEVNEKRKHYNLPSNSRKSPLPRPGLPHSPSSSSGISKRDQASANTSRSDRLAASPPGGVHKSRSTTSIPGGFDD